MAATNHALNPPLSGARLQARGSAPSAASTPPTSIPIEQYSLARGDNGLMTPARRCMPSRLRIAVLGSSAELTNAGGSCWRGGRGSVGKSGLGGGDRLGCMRAAAGLGVMSGQESRARGGVDMLSCWRNGGGGARGQCTLPSLPHTLVESPKGRSGPSRSSPLSSLVFPDFGSRPSHSSVCCLPKPKPSTSSHFQAILTHLTSTPNTFYTPEAEARPDCLLTRPGPVEDLMMASPSGRGLVLEEATLHHQHGMVVANPTNPSALPMPVFVSFDDLGNALTSPSPVGMVGLPGE